MLVSHQQPEDDEDLGSEGSCAKSSYRLGSPTPPLVSDDFQRLQAGAPIKAVKLKDVHRHLPRRFSNALDPTKLRTKVLKRLRELGPIDAKEFNLDTPVRIAQRDSNV
jgi:hypothetical protein